VPAEQHAALAQAWAEGDSLWPLTGLPLDEHLPDLLATLAADNAQADLQRVFKAQFEGRRPTCARPRIHWACSVPSTSATRAITASCSASITASWCWA
jgi:hypothetical protein